ncbi:serine/threonine-protein kinase Pink1, mitochondrial-like [Haliotis rufescens]|uniref:serine/threonine-protein kinase Pink1, mitochondrial-like n=1 Tax=Haliotis rufescens TaxID=6454 RepID=UPI00201E9ED0|nr:serine/threonine-protein kinase Pink1, mitochondrial-like [Haliotis rufescens]
MKTAAANLRRDAAMRLISAGIGRRGRNLPLFAFVSVAFSTKNNLSSQEERDNVFSKIRELHESKTVSEPSGVHILGLEDLDIGPLIDKGCNAAVYEARPRGRKVEDIRPPFATNGMTIQPPANESRNETANKTDPEASPMSLESSPEREVAPVVFEDSDSDFTILDTEDSLPLDELKQSHAWSSDGELTDTDQEMIDESDSDISILDSLGSIGQEPGALDTGFEELAPKLCEEMGPTFFKEMGPSVPEEESDSDITILEVEDDSILIMKTYKTGDAGAEVSSDASEESDSDMSILEDDGPPGSCTAGVVEEHLKLLMQDVPSDPEDKDPQLDATPSCEYDLALKMMFNYDVESNAEAVLTAMEKEAVPMRMTDFHQQQDSWHNGNRVKNKTVSPHPNIVCMQGVFVDSVPDLPDNRQHYPAALPTRIDPNGFGRNMTMFLLMKKYTCTLREFLNKESPNMATRCLLLAQLLEGVVCLQHDRIAHRDLKSDNLLLDLSNGTENPTLVISDFGCCLCEDSLQVPYNTSEINKGGNAALMAPEIACARVGKSSMLDYSKADLWAVGALAYEIFGKDNPFYRSTTNPHRLDSKTFREEDLPPLPDDVPVAIKHLVRNLLCRDPARRLSVDVAATVMQLCLFMPQQWIQAGRSVCLQDIQEWVVLLAAQLTLTTVFGQAHTAACDALKKTFLSRISYKDLKSAVSFVSEINIL